ncbi:hypothetical protein CsSME_00025943 [Camellia sinensis var. sinensis]
MKITVMTADEQIVTLDVDRDESVENLKALLEVEVRSASLFSFRSLCIYMYLLDCDVSCLLCEQTQVPLQQQQLLYNGREIKNAEKLSAVGVNDGDLVMMVSRASSRFVFCNFLFIFSFCIATCYYTTSEF